MAKNKLQEFCQARGHELPIYESNQTGPPHQPVWRSIVRVCGKEFSSSPYQTKKAAEADAAIKALSLTCKISSPPGSRRSPDPKIPLEKRPILKVKKKTALLVDVENLPKLISQLPLFEGPMMVFAFVGKHHHLSSVEYDRDICVVISPSTRPDGTDTCMQVYTGKFLLENEYEAYLIATRDHFGASLVDIITSDHFEWPPKKGVLVTTADHVIEEVMLM